VTLRDRLLGIILTREPDFIVGGVTDPYLLRWWVIPRNRFFNVYLHLFLRSDDDRALHDHPWLFNCSMLLEGSYIEWVPDGKDAQNPIPVYHSPGTRRFRWGRATHRIELHTTLSGIPKPCTTLFITGPVVREWGFWCPKRWVPWKIFTATAKGVSTTGRGCE
jgi:hypothetical protein